MYKVAILGCENSHADSFLNFIIKEKKFPDVEVVGVYTDEEEAKLVSAIENIDIGKMKTKYEPVSGAPYFPFILEYSDDRTVEIYFSGEYMHINGVPFEIDEATEEKLAALHDEIEGKILPLSPEIIEEIIDKKLPQ